MIVGHGLFSSVGVQCICSGTLGVVDAAVPISTASEVEGEFGKVIPAHGLLGLISSLKDVTNEPMKASTTRGADFSVQALTNFVVAEREASRPIGSDEMCMCSLNEILFNHFYLLLLDGR